MNQRSGMVMCKRRYGGIIIVLLGMLIWSIIFPTVMAAPPTQSPDEGRTIFEQKCASCHTIGGGKRVGPDLKGVTKQRDKDWLIRWITVPDKMLAEGDPIAQELLQEYNNVPMPNLGLSPEEAAAVLAFIESESGEGTSPAPSAQPAAVTKGDAARGRALFIGAEPLQNGGPACRSCHSLGALGFPDGGTLGPALDDVIRRYNGEEALFAWLQSPPTEVMRAVWQDHPITEQDRADLVAFLASVQSTPPSRVVPTLILFAIALAIAIVFLIIVQLVWRHRLNGVRRTLVNRA